MDKVTRRDIIQNHLKGLKWIIVNILLLLTNTKIGFSQVDSTLVEIGNSLYEDVYNPVVKNLATFYMVKQYGSQLNDPSVSKGIIFSSNLLESPIPNLGTSYRLEINRAFFVNNTEYDFYRYRIVPVSYYKNFCNGEKDEIMLPPGNGYLYFYFMYNVETTYGLVAFRKPVDPFASTIIFVGGEMYLDDVKKIFFKNVLNEKNVAQYILMRYYNYFPEILENNYSKSHKVVFYSTLLKKKFEVTAFPDKVDVIREK